LENRGIKRMGRGGKTRKRNEGKRERVKVMGREERKE
jgi:hypothetical protein